jgi:GT2 family glycosyltransferase
MLQDCLASVSACEPGPAEVLVVDQSGLPSVAVDIGRVADVRIRHVPCSGTGVSSALNLGLGEASHDVVLVTHDDCTVDSSWVGAAAELMTKNPERIVTGRVLPVGDPRAVPSTKIDPEPQDYSGTLDPGVLYPNNMALSRDAVLAIGGFDERYGPGEAAEDVDFCYRWLKSGHGLQYDPGLVVWHHEWRSHDDLERAYRAYARGQGATYAKHLRRGDTTIIRFMARTVYAALRGFGDGLVSDRPRWADPRRSLFPSLLEGFVWGWRALR